MTDKPRSRAWQILRRVALALASLLSIYIAVYLFFWLRAGPAIEREKVKVAQQTAELRNLRDMRPNLFEPAEEGNSWDLIEKTLQFPMSEDDRDEFPILREDFSTMKATGDLDRVLETLRPALESLKGALRRRYVEPVEWRTKDDWWNHGHSEHVSYTTWSLILKAAAEFRHQQGKDDQALEFITLGLGLADRA